MCFEESNEHMLGEMVISFYHKLRIYSSFVLTLSCNIYIERY